MRHLLFAALFFSTVTATAQEMSGTELLKKAMAHHDPNGNWGTFNETFVVTMASPKNPDRVSTITINLPDEYFMVKAAQDTLTTQYVVNKGKCGIFINNAETPPTPQELKKHNLSCERANLYKNYYTYLYGLPMKLKDPGTHIAEKATVGRFLGKKFWVLKVTYDERVGNEVWYFYFDPKTYALATYQFYKGDPEGAGKGTGEYILLSGTETIGGIKMPKTRKWYYNKNGVYLGTDTLTKK
ncbi:MAG: DUF6503 family protein [Marinirhabdus sp.]